jgi:hypothetical protein
LSILALAAQKCELESESIMIGILALTSENPTGLTVDHLNKVLFDGLRYQIAQRMLDNGVATGELKKVEDTYFLTEFGQADLDCKKAWVNEQTASWELLCFDDEFCKNTESIMRKLSMREKKEAGWRPIEDLKDYENFKSAYSIWTKISQKSQLSVLINGEQRGVLLVNEFAEPPAPNESDRILARTCIFDITLELLAAKKWIIKSLNYSDQNDINHAVPFELGESEVEIIAPDYDEWQEILEKTGLFESSEGDYYCYYSPDLDIDYSKLKVSRINIMLSEWEITFEDVSLRARNKDEALSWFSKKLANTCGKTVSTIEILKSEAIEFLALSGTETTLLNESEIQALIVNAINTLVSNRRGDASRLGFIYDFET